ncbi:PucR C-terminal helix-turn-helix domain-containing protein [Nonomuraea solani]|uniref:PucR C-terminal helix-turn-helix domain-containing protein n=1 Tax=Nonomuraea solani TaxID=1144553 RepID=A0A1H6EYE2_9ACTN|nr:helix-turn-helix domain-containing protein [Nonomuraea solani]SEH01955.1 PucR C-terminal helix-turn-helix domain-containing protein [Nonomuraea solani]
MSGVRAAGWEAPVTVAELVNAGPLAGARMYGAGDDPVRGVRIVDELSVLATVAPHTAVVLIGTAASGGWAVEMAVRRAWEQAAACVIAPSGGLSEGSGEVLAERLGVTLIFVDEDPLIVAVRVASAASRPDAARTQLVARCATRLADAGTSARRVLGVLNAELPGTSVAFLDPHGLPLAGRRDALPDQPQTGNPPNDRPPTGPGDRPSTVGASGARPGAGGTPDGAPLAGDAAGGGFGSGRGLGVGGSGGRWSAVVEVPDHEGRVLGTLVASGSSRSPGWPSVVRTVLGLAVAPLTAWAARERLRASRDFTVQASLAERLLTESSRTATPPGDLAETSADDVGTPEDGAWATAIALGWPVHGPITTYVIHAPARTDDDGPSAQTLITAALGPVPVIARKGGWAGWSALDPAQLADRLEHCLTTMPWPATAGVGAPVNDLSAAEESLLGAEAAAFVAAGQGAAAGRTGTDEGGRSRRAGQGAVVRADRTGPVELLGALPASVLSAPAAVVLRPLLSVDKDGTLLETLAALLDEGGALRAAERLGVHRNTITTRLERIKSAGFDLDDPATRLALHLACHVMRR